MKALIWDKGIPLKNTGGPSGYLYNIHEYWKVHQREEITFYSDLYNSKLGGNETTDTSHSFIERLLSIKFFKFCYSLYSIYFKKELLSENEIDVINEYDFIHIHTFSQYMTSFANEKRINSRIIVTTHCPEPCFDEVCGLFQYKTLFKVLSPIRSWFIKRECNKLSVADYILLPVKEAVEAYTCCSRHYKRFFNSNENKLLYVPTAIYPSDIVETNNNPLENFSISDNTLKVCFVGRHNQIKGYDKLKEIGLEAIRRNIDVHFIVGGKEEPLKGIVSERWTELGWVNTFEVLNNVDVFILPNKQTYFDLILIEVLRQGKTCIISRTGGNKWFSKFHNTGIFLYDYGKEDDVIDILTYLIELKKQGGLGELEKQNRGVFLNYLTLSKFIDAYINQLNMICQK